MILQFMEKLFEGQDVIGLLIMLPYGIEGKIIQVLGQSCRPVNHLIAIDLYPEMVLLGLHSIFDCFATYRILEGSIQSKHFMFQMTSDSKNCP